MAKVVWRKRAIKDRYAIVEYVAERNPGAALALDADFVAKAQICYFRRVVCDGGPSTGCGQ